MTTLEFIGLLVVGAAVTGFTLLFSVQLPQPAKVRENLTGTVHTLTPGWVFLLEAVIIVTVSFLLYKGFWMAFGIWFGAALVVGAVTEAIAWRVTPKEKTDLWLKEKIEEEKAQKQSSTCNFAGKVVPVTKNVDEFVHIVRVEKKPIGLLVRIKDWMLTYGQLLHHGESSKPNPFQVGPRDSCHLICAKCNVELDAAMLANLGPDSVMSAFGVAPVNQCHICGSSNVIIVFARGRKKGKSQRESVTRDHDSTTLTPATVRKLAQEGADAVEPLIAALQHEEDMGVRKAAARALGQIGDRRAIEPLLDIALGYGDKPLQAEADKALVAIGEPALPATIAMLKRSDWHTQIQAVDLLGKMGNPQAVAPLAAAMHKEMKSSGDYVTASNYVTALGQIGGEAAAKALTEALQYPVNRQAAARWLERIGAEAVAPLIVVLGDASVGKTAARVLVKIGGPAVEPLIATLDDSDLPTQSAAVDALRKLAADTTLEQSLRDQASAALEQLSDKGVIFVRKMKRDRATYELYAADDAEKAKDFLLKKKVTRKFYYVEVETPNGTWGIDKDGMYLDKLLPWQKNLSLGKYEGEISIWPSIHAIMVANQGLMDNAVAGIHCGKCEHEWWDGIRLNELTIVRCPKCQTYNKIKGGKIHIHETTV